MKNIDIFIGLANFTAVSLIFLLIISIIFAVFSKKVKFNTNKVELYGLFLNLDTPSLLSISTLTINYLFLVWCTVSFSGLNIIYVAFTLILVLFSDIILDNFKNIPLSLLFTSINCAAIEIVYLIHDHLTEEKFSYLLAIILFLIILFIFLYYTYNLFRQINNIAIKQKYIKEKNYKL